MQLHFNGAMLRSFLSVVVGATLALAGCDTLRGLIQVGDVTVGSGNTATVNVDGIGKLADKMGQQQATGSNGLSEDDRKKIKDDFKEVAKDIASSSTTTIIVVPASESATVSPTPVPAAWKELTGTFRFTGLINGQAAQILGGAYDYSNNRPVFWVKPDMGQEGAFALTNASPSLAVARFEPLPEITEPFDQKTFFGKLNGKPSIVSSFNSNTGIVNFRPEYSPNLASMTVPGWWFSDQHIQTEEDVGGLLIVGKIWTMLVIPNFNPAQIRKLSAPNAPWQYTEDVKSYGSSISYAFYSPPDGHFFFFTKAGAAYAEEDGAITPL